MPDTPFGSSNPSRIRVWLDIPRTITTYTETPFRIVDGIRIGKAGGAITRRDSFSVEFAGRLTALVQDMFNETVTAAKSTQQVNVIAISGLRSFFDNDLGGQFTLNPINILATDLLCYIRLSRSISFYKDMDRARWLGLASNASGVTYPDTGGVLSEAWFKECGDDVVGVANTIYHELMHNKTKFSTGENADWVHGAAGGGGLARATSAGPLAAFTGLNKLAMARRFAVKNKQYTAGLH